MAMADDWSFRIDL